MNNIKSHVLGFSSDMRAHAQSGVGALSRKMRSNPKVNSRIGVLKKHMRSLSHPHFSLNDQVFFAKRLAFLINANVPLIEGLSILKEQSRRGSHRRMLEAILDDVANGQSISKSFSKYPRVFGTFAVAIIQVGETSGTLSQNLNYLADELKKKQILRRKLISASIYPVIITCAVIGITAFLMLYLFPKIMPIFASLHATLPLTTRIVMATSIFFQEWGLWFLLGVFFLVLLSTFILKKSVTVRHRFHTMLLHFPFIGRVIQHYNIANTTRTLGLLLKSGVRVSEALPITAQTAHNLAYRAQFVKMTDVVVRGERLSSYLTRHDHYFPKILSHMIAVGERSGTLSDTLVYLSEFYEHEVDEFTKNISTLVEPALMIVMGVVVGFIAISIITPIYGITQNLHG